jgi:hypothetical protein
MATNPKGGGMLSIGNRGPPSEVGQWIPQSAGWPDRNPWLLRKAVAGSAGLLATSWHLVVPQQQGGADWKQPRRRGTAESQYVRESMVHGAAHHTPTRRRRAFRRIATLGRRFAWDDRRRRLPIGRLPFLCKQPRRLAPRPSRYGPARMSRRAGTRNVTQPSAAMFNGAPSGQR